MRSILARRFAPLALHALLVSAALASTTRADVIGLDAVHLSETFPEFVLANGVHFDSFRATLVADGHQLVSLNAFEQADLAGLDAAFLVGTFQAQNKYTLAEQAAVRQFVLSGGGVVFCCDGGSVSDAFLPNTNKLLAPFGIRFVAGMFAPNGNVVGQFAKHPLLDGVDSIQMDFYRRVKAEAWPASDLTLLGGSADVLASARLRPQSGLLVALGDINQWNDAGAFSDASIDAAGNRRLLRNITRAMLEPPPCSQPSRLYGSATSAVPGAPLPRLYSDCPAAGFGMRVCVDSGPALARGLLLIGLAEASIPLDGITQLVAPLLAIPHQLDAAGAWTQGVPVPSAPLLAGMPLYFQVGYGTSASKLAASQALEWRP